MTCVVGIVGKKGVLLAADSQWSGENAKGIDTDSKVFALSSIVAMGCCGSGRVMQVLKHAVADGMEDPPVDGDLRRWFVRELQPRIAGTLEAFGALSRWREDGIEELGDSALLLAVRDRLFTVESDFSINESFRPFVGLASGGEASQGAMHGEFGKLQLPDEPVSKSWKWMEEVAARAIQAAADDTLYVGGPVRFVRTERYTADEKALAKIVLEDGPTLRQPEGWYE